MDIRRIYLNRVSVNILEGGKEKFTWCIMEMILFHDHPKGSGLITNLINRLKILLMEDLSLSEMCILSVNVVRY